jgi:oligopeptide transport system substrate-binding protein
MRIFVINLMWIICITGLNSCKNNPETTEESSKSSKKEGNVIRIAEIATPSSIFPHAITNAVEAMICSQIFEGLVKINPKDLTVMPGLAESWEIDQDTRTITFHLRKGLKFQRKDPVPESDLEITSRDVKFTFELLCTSRPGNVQFQTVCKDRILGANEFYLASIQQQKAELKGFRIMDDHTFSITLLNSPGTFLEILTNPVAGIISQKAYNMKQENSSVGAGPFILDEAACTKTHYVLYRNLFYYGRDEAGRALPYIDSLIVEIAGSTEEALDLFQTGKADFISSVPGNQLRGIVEDNIKSFKNPAIYMLEQKPEMISYFYLFNIHRPPFNNLKLRQAINYAIDRSKIIDRVLYGQAYGPAVYGIVPPTFDFYDIKTIKGYDFNLEKARKLLSEAGYPDGKNLPEMQLIVNSGNSRNNTVAAEIQRQLKVNLNINLSFESLPNAEKYNLQLKRQGNLFRDGWVADYPNPESFLSIFYGEPVNNDSSLVSFPNTMRYCNRAFDKYYELGRDATSRDSAMTWFLKAEQVLVNDAPLIPLWYESNCRLIKTRMQNFYSNPLSYFDFTRVSIKDKK